MKIRLYTILYTSVLKYHSYCIQRLSPSLAIYLSLSLCFLSLGPMPQKQRLCYFPNYEQAKALSKLTSAYVINSNNLSLIAGNGQMQSFPGQSKRRTLVCKKCFGMTMGKWHTSSSRNSTCSRQHTFQDNRSGHCPPSFCLWYRGCLRHPPGGKQRHHQLHFQVPHSAVENARRPKHPDNSLDKCPWAVKHMKHHQTEILKSQLKI